MGLKAQNRIGAAIAGAATAIYRISIIKEAIDKGLVFIQAFGHGDPDDPDNQELVQEMDLDKAQHYGLETRAPAGVDVEGVVADADGGEVCIAERFNMEQLDTHGTADAMPARSPGDTVLYAKDGSYVFMDEDGKLTIKAMSGNVEIITEAGDIIKLGHDGVDYNRVAYSDTTEATASQVAVAAGLKTYMGKIDADLAAIKIDGTNTDATFGTIVANLVVINAWILNHTTLIIGTPFVHPVPPIPVVTGPPGVKIATTLVPTTGALAIDTNHSYVSTGSAKVFVEP